MSTSTLFGDLVGREHLRYETFAAEYAKIAAEVARGSAAPSRAQFYRWLSGNVKRVPYPDACRVLEVMFPPFTAEDLFSPAAVRAEADTALLESVPHSFPAEALAGPWVTCYRFTHGDELRYHADIAHITATSEKTIRAVNNPPEPRTEGHAHPFHNQIQAQLTNRHLLGHWKNTSDTRYFGALQLAVLPDENVMDGYCTGFGSDIEVSLARWRWVRLRVDPGADLAGLVLRDPATLHDLVMAHSQYDAPLALADVGEDT